MSIEVSLRNFPLELSSLNRADSCFARSARRLSLARLAPATAMKRSRPVGFLEHSSYKRHKPSHVISLLSDSDDDDDDGSSGSGGNHSTATERRSFGGDRRHFHTKPLGPYSASRAADRRSERVERYLIETDDEDGDEGDADGGGAAAGADDEDLEVTVINEWAGVPATVKRRHLPSQRFISLTRRVSTPNRETHEATEGLQVMPSLLPNESSKPTSSKASSTPQPNESIKPSSSKAPSTPQLNESSKPTSSKVSSTPQPNESSKATSSSSSKAPSTPQPNESSKPTSSKAPSTPQLNESSKPTSSTSSKAPSTSDRKSVV